MNDKAKEFIEIREGCDLFFKETLDDALGNQHLRISQEVAFYLLGILLIGVRKGPDDETRSVAERYMLAQSNEQVDELKAVGDSSLIIAGIWWQSLLRRLVDVDYYIAVGSRSYQKASEVSPKNLADLFEELSDNFNSIVNVMAEATRCISEANMSNNDVLRIYEVWLRTHNTFLEKKLRSLGINVVPGKTTKQ